MKYSIIFGSTGIQLGELAGIDIPDAYKIYKESKCIATSDFPWCKIYADISDEKMQLSLCENMSICIQNNIFSNFIPINVTFNQHKIFNDESEIWFDCKPITPTNKEKELIKRESWLKDILFPKVQCHPTKSILFSKNSITIEYIDPNLKLIAHGYTRKLIGQREDDFSLLVKSLRTKNTPKTSSAYNDDLDTDQQNQAYWEELGLF